MFFQCSLILVPSRTFKWFKRALFVTSKYRNKSVNRNKRRVTQVEEHFKGSRLVYEKYLSRPGNLIHGMPLYCKHTVWPTWHEGDGYLHDKTF